MPAVRTSIPAPVSAEPQNTGCILNAIVPLRRAARISCSFVASTAEVASSTPAQDMATLTPAALPEVVVPAVLGSSRAVGGLRSI